MKNPDKEERDSVTPEEKQEIEHKETSASKKRGRRSTESQKSPSKSQSWNLTDEQFQNIIRRVQIITLSRQGYGESMIVKALENTVSANMVKKWRNCELSPKDLTDANRTGRPVEFDQHFVHDLLERAKKKGFSPRKFVRSKKYHVSRTEVRDILHRHKLYPYKKRKASRLTAEHVANRLKFCKWLSKQPLSYFDKLLITDSKIWRLDGGYNPQNARYWRLDTNEVPVHETDKYSEGWHFHGGISARGCTRLIRITSLIPLC